MAEDFIPKVYDPVKYWNNRKQPNTTADPGVSKDDADFFYSSFSAGDSILEIGPGVGRLFKLYTGASSVTTIDITDSHQAVLRAKAEEYGFPLVQKLSADPKAPLPFNDDQFTIGVSSFVFIHIPFDTIRHTILELARTCRKVVCYVGTDPIWPRTEEQMKSSSHCFGHDYKAIIAALGLHLYNWQEGLNPKSPIGWEKFTYGQ